MSSKGKSTKNIIVDAAWDLFYKNGYDHTTIDDIVEASNTSKGSFYHYFRSKSDLLGTIPYLFDEFYEGLMDKPSPSLSPIKKLMYITDQLFNLIDSRIPEPLIAEYMALQITAKGDRYFLDHERAYYRLLRHIFAEGVEQGIFTDEFRRSEMIRCFATFERGLVYDWCLAKANYNLPEYGKLLCRGLLKGILKEEYYYMLDE